MSAVINPVQVTASDRLGFSLFVAAILHAIIILGLGFGLPFARDFNTASMLEVTMVLTKTHQEPTDAEHIASENQLASGSTDQENQPSAPFTGASLNATNGIAPVQSITSSSPASEFSEQHEPLVVLNEAQDNVFINDAVETPDQPSLDYQEKLSEQQLELAKLVAELRQEENDYAKRPRVNYIDTLSAKTATEATYVREWVEKVEGVGNLNYPDEVRNKHLSGTLILSVLLNHDGTVELMEVRSSAGKSLLDESAKRIVNIASPYQAFPPEMRESYDQLMITRTWLFGKDNTLLTE
ncbi:MAG: energy transducer TonB [Gammaproteobacteria bacterium]|nr:energy transducer TonB [Gammaproteobacteria bacterium]